MAAEKVKVQTSDKDIIEVDLDIAKQWGPIKTIYEGRIIFKIIHSFHYFSLI
jgi:hypothetical protein